MNLKGESPNNAEDAKLIRPEWVPQAYCDQTIQIAKPSSTTNLEAVSDQDQSCIPES